MYKIAGSILILAAAVSGHGVFVFLASHPRLHHYEVPNSVANMVLTAVSTSAVLGLLGLYYLMKNDVRR